MKYRNIMLFAVVIFAVSALAVSAEEKKGSDMELSGKMYINWQKNMTDEGENKTGTDKRNTFNLERAYITFTKLLDETWSMRITANVDNLEAEDHTHDDNVPADGGTGENKYYLYLKYAYVQGKTKMGPLSCYLRFGIVQTPVIGYMDELSDQRWLHKILLDDSKTLLPRKPDGSRFILDDSADMGVHVGVSYQKIVEIVGTICNGEGYKRTDELAYDNTDQGKAYAGRITISPIEQLKISGFYRKNETTSNSDDNNEGYWGGGIAWADKTLIMVGGNYYKPFLKIAGNTPTDVVTGKEYDWTIVEAWLTLKLNSLIGIPLFIMGRGGYGDSGLDNGKVTFMGGCVGYELSKNVRFAAWYQQYDSEAADEAKDANPVKTFYLKSEIKY